VDFLRDLPTSTLDFPTLASLDIGFPTNSLRNTLLGDSITLKSLEVERTCSLLEAKKVQWGLPFISTQCLNSSSSMIFDCESLYTLCPALSGSPSC
jgi:hypothetical protein